jgi:hypothetical protein
MRATYGAVNVSANDDNVGVLHLLQRMQPVVKTGQAMLRPLADIEHQQVERMLRQEERVRRVIDGLPAKIPYLVGELAPVHRHAHLPLNHSVGRQRITRHLLRHLTVRCCLRVGLVDGRNDADAAGDGARNAARNGCGARGSRQGAALRRGGRAAVG